MKVLIIRYSSIGDIVLTSPIIRGAKQQLGATVHFLTKQRMQQVVQHNPYIDKIYSIREHNREVMGYLLAEEYDVVIDLHKNIRSRQVVRKLGVTTYTFDKINLEKWLLVNLKIDRMPDKHLVDRYYEGMRSLGITNDGEGLDHHVAEADDAYARSYYQAGGSYRVAVLGATYYTKRIPTDRLRHMISSDSDNKYVLLGGKDVIDEGESLVDMPNVYNTCGKITLGQSAALISYADHVITGDTGMMHIAAAYKRPITMVWGSTSPVLGMYPYYGSYDIRVEHLQVDGLRCRPCTKIGKDTCPKGHYKCMEW